MEWVELELNKAIWTTPAAKAKVLREHHVPLSRQAIEIIAQMRDSVVAHFGNGEGRHGEH